MARLEISYTYPDNWTSKLLEAFKSHYGQIQDGTTPEGNPIWRDRTPAEVNAELKKEIKRHILKVVNDYDERQTAKAALEARTPLKDEDLS